MEIDKLTLLSGNDIFIAALRVNIHQPTLKEIGILGEENFYKYLSIFKISVDSVAKALVANSKDGDSEITADLVKSALSETSDFEVFMQVLKEDQLAQIGFKTIMMLLLPKHSSFEYEERFIMCMSKDSVNVIIDETGFEALREVIDKIFCLNVTRSEEFNPVGKKAKSIAEKIKKGREKVREVQGLNQEKVYILANYVSALAIGSNALNINDTIDLTVYQLFNQMERFGLYTQHNHALKAMAAGAKDVELVDWLKNL
jgi:hypothetical protein